MNKASPRHSGLLWTTVVLCLAVPAILLPATATGGAEVPAGLKAAGTVSLSPAGEAGTFPGALSIRDNLVQVDLSVIPEGSEVLRAVLHLRREPGTLRGGEDAARLPVKVTVEGRQPPMDLSLRPPRFLDLDATDAVQRGLSDGEGDTAREASFRVVSFAGWKRERTRLDVTFRGGKAGPAEPAAAARKAFPAVRQVRAWHLDGQTFLTWLQPEPGLDRETATIRDLREARAAGGPEIRYRIYRSADRIAPGTLEKASLLDEVDGFTAWNGEFHGIYPKPEDPVLRYVVRDGGDPLRPGTGIYVHRAADTGSFWYAVSVARDGEEDFACLRAAGCVAGPVAEQPGPGHPVLQRIERPESFLYVRGPTIQYYVRWESPPECNLPSRPFDYLVGIPPESRDPAALCIALHCWGGSLRGGYGWWYGAREGALLVATNQIPYDWWACYHEHLHTLKPFSQGVVRSYSPKRVWSFVEWMHRKWSIDRSRTFMGGNSMGGSGVSHWIRYGDRIAYGISWVGVHIPRESPHFRGSYENVVGKAEWNLPHESGQPVFDYLDGARWLREHPGSETAFLAYANGKNDGGIGWKQAVDFTRALQETRRPHLFVWGQGGHGQRAWFPTATGGGDNVRDPLDIRLDRSLPAFTRCSLDDDPGDGDPADGDPEGQINKYPRWDPGGVVDRERRYSIEVYLIEGAPRTEATVDITPRRCRMFRPAPGEEVDWSLLPAGGGPPVAGGSTTADALGLITVSRVPLTTEKRTLEIRRRSDRREDPEEGG